MDGKGGDVWFSFSFLVFVIRGYLLVLDHLYYISSFNKFSFCGFYLFFIYSLDLGGRYQSVGIVVLK